MYLALKCRSYISAATETTVSPLCALSGIISGQLRSDSLGNTEMLRPLVAPRNRQSPRQVTTSR